MPYEEVLAEMPKVTDNQQESIYLPLADYLNAGIVRPSEEYFKVLPDGTLVPIVEEGMNIVLQDVKVVQIYENGNFTVKPDGGYNAIGQVLLEITVPILDTSDATATEGLVVKGYTYYANGEKKSGTMPSVTENTPSLTLETSGNGLVNIKHSQTFNTYLPAGETIIGTVAEANLIPSNIKKDVTILGVAGEYGGAYKGDWTANTTYNLDDIVTYQGSVYRCLNENTDSIPDNYIGMFWERLNTSSGGDGAYKGEYSGYNYAVGDIVTFKGNVYLCLQPPVEGMPEPDSPDVTDFWEQLNSSNPTGSKTIPAGTYKLSYTPLTAAPSIPSSVSSQLTATGTAYQETEPDTVVNFDSFSVNVRADSLGAYICNGTSIAMSLYLKTHPPIVITINSDITAKAFSVDLFNLMAVRI